MKFLFETVDHMRILFFFFGNINNAISILASVNCSYGYYFFEVLWNIRYKSPIRYVHRSIKFNLWQNIFVFCLLQFIVINVKRNYIFLLERNITCKVFVRIIVCFILNKNLVAWYTNFYFYFIVLLILRFIHFLN